MFVGKENCVKTFEKEKCVLQIVKNCNRVGSVFSVSVGLCSKSVNLSAELISFLQND